MTTPTPEAAAAVAATEASEGLALVRAFAIATAQEYETAISMIAEVKKQRAVYEEKRTEITVPLNLALRRINDLFRPATTACDEAEKILKQKVLQYQVDANKERERLLAEAEMQAQGGDLPAANLAIEQASAAIVPTRADGGAAGQLSVRTDWVGEVFDASLLPKEYLIPDVAKLEAVTKAAKADPKIPGWKAWAKPVAIVRQK